MKRNLQGDLKTLPRALTAKVCGKRCNIPKPCLQACSIRCKAGTSPGLRSRSLMVLCGTSDDPRNPRRAASGIKQRLGNYPARSTSYCINQRYGLTNLPAHPSATLRSTCKARWWLPARGHGSAAAKCRPARNSIAEGLEENKHSL